MGKSSEIVRTGEQWQRLDDAKPKAVKMLSIIFSVYQLSFYYKYTVKKIAIVRCQLVVLLRRSEQNIILCLLKISFLKPKQKIRKKKFQKKMPEGGCRT